MRRANKPFGFRSIVSLALGATKKIENLLILSRKRLIIFIFIPVLVKRMHQRLDKDKQVYSYFLLRDYGTYSHTYRTTQLHPVDEVWPLMREQVPPEL